MSLSLRATVLACLTLGFGLPQYAVAGQSPARRPNFVFVYTDDQRWDAMGVVQREHGERARFPWLKTPHMDRLAAEGVRFRNAFVVNSLCAPSRASFLTGCYGHVNGVVNNHTPFPVENVTHAGLLRQAGYTTAYVGKWHMDGQRGQRPGFDFSASFIGQGRYVDCPVEVNGKPTETKGWVDDVCTDYALQFLRENKDRPFLLVVGFKAAHGPFDPPPRRKGDYAGEEARAVPNFGTPAIYRGETRPPGADVKPGDKVPTNLNYFRCITAADDNLGRILQALDELKLADDTMVIFASDNGYYLGEHGLGDKRSAYDESLRIPLLVRYPKLGGKGKAIDPLTLNIDLAPTLLDYAGVAVPKAMQGRSWRPLLEGRAGDWRKAFFYCYFYENNFRVPTVTAVRSETAKLVKYPGHDEWTELFDLGKDPYEVKNLNKDPGAAALRKDLEAEYERQKAAVDFRIPPFADDPKQGGPQSPLKAWVLEYRFDKDEGDKVMDDSGKDNHGTARGAPLAEGWDGGKARRFDGKGYLEVPKSASLNPAVAGWTVEVTFRAEKPDGILLARGGRSNGYCLHLEGGKPVFTVVSQGRASRVVAGQAVGTDWVRVTARITAGRRLALAIDGKPAGEAPLHDFIARDPNDGMQVGADLGSRVIEGPALPQFVGRIAAVRLYSGEAP
jgi:arylsulfatase A-like enzyme